MSINEQKELKEEYYNEAVRYMENAKDILKKAGKEDRYYKDAKDVKMACGTAYSAVLLALDGLFKLKDISAPQNRKSIEYYIDNIKKVDKKMLNHFNSTYEILHLSGYYDGIKNVKVIADGFDVAYTIIKKIKP